MEFLTQLTAYHWFALGLILFGAEALGTAGFLLGAAVGALANGVLVWMLPELSVGWQLTSFSLASVLATAVYFQMFRDAQARDESPPINQRAESLIGHRFKLGERLSYGTGRVQIGDTYWSVAANQTIEAETNVSVIGVDGMTLQVAPTE